MDAALSSFYIQKEGNTSDEYEDAFYPESIREITEDTFSIAISDGSSEGMLCQQWAEILTKVYCRLHAWPLDFENFLQRAYDDWKLQKAEYMQERERRNRSILWYEQPGFQEGAFSTILGLTIADVSCLQGQWRAIALGDSCLFQIRNNALLRKFPVERASDFSSRPLLLASEPIRNQHAIEAVATNVGEWQIDDSFYLMTDALAHWFLEEYELGNHPWLTLADFDTIDQRLSFDLWVKELRELKQIRNDDTTMLRIDLMPPS